MDTKVLRSMIEERLAELVVLRTADCPKVGETAPRLQESMAYSLLAGGKRLRPMMLLKAGEMLGVAQEEMLDMA